MNNTDTFSQEPSTIYHSDPASEELSGKVAESSRYASVFDNRTLVAKGSSEQDAQDPSDPFDGTDDVCAQLFQ